MLQQLIKERQELNCSILSILEAEVTAIKIAADNMAECATNIKGQGYSMFIRSREDLMEKIDKLRIELSASSIMSDCCTLDR